MQITQRGITVPIAPAATRTTVAAICSAVLACLELEKSKQTPALNPHSPTPPPAQTPPRFPPSRLFGRLPPCIARTPVTGRRPKTLNESRRSVSCPENPSRSRSFEFGTALPAPKETLAARSGNGVAGWRKLAFPYRRRHAHPRAISDNHQIFSDDDLAFKILCRRRPPRIVR